jgi:hypothetical protein
MHAKPDLVGTRGISKEISIQHGRENEAKLPSLADPPSADSVTFHASGPSCNHSSPFASLVLPRHFLSIQRL